MIGAFSLPSLVSVLCSQVPAVERILPWLLGSQSTCLGALSPLLLYPVGTDYAQVWRLRVLAFQRSVSYVTQGWVDRSITLLADIPFRNPLYCSDIVLCIALGMTVFSDLSTHLTGCLIINSTEEIGTLVTVTNK